MPKKEDIKTRPDLDDEQYLVWLASQPENRGIDVRGLYRSMLDWCGKKRITPTRRRLLRWLDGEREAVPMTILPTRDVMKTTAIDGAEPKCKRCHDLGEIQQKPKNAKFDWQLEFIPCPDCKPEAANA